MGSTVRKIVLALGIALSSAAQGAFVSYPIILEVTYVEQQPFPSCQQTPLVPTSWVGQTHGCSNSVGDRHIGTFSLDESLLLADGAFVDVLNNQNSDFSLQIGTLIYGPHDGFQYSEFVVTAGRLTGLFFKDLVDGGSALPRIYLRWGETFTYGVGWGNFFDAIDWTCCDNIPGTAGTWLLGNVAIPEPSSGLLFVTALAIIVLRSGGFQIGRRRVLR